MNFKKKLNGDYFSQTFGENKIKDTQKVRNQ